MRMNDCLDTRNRGKTRARQVDGQLIVSRVQLRTAAESSRAAVAAVKARVQCRGTHVPAEMMQRNVFPARERGSSRLPPRIQTSGL